MINLQYDILGYAKLGNCWIKKPLIEYDTFLVIVGDHPHNPEGAPYKTLGPYKDESIAVEHAQERYRAHLMAELDKLS